jgi:hypothetical protein
MAKSTYKRSSRKTGNNSRRTITQNSNGSRTVSNSRNYSTGSTKTVSHNSKTGRTRTTYTVRNGGGWINRYTSTSGPNNSPSARKSRGTKSKGSSRSRMSGGYPNYGNTTWGEIFKDLLFIIMCYIGIAVGAILLLFLLVWILF